MITKKLRATETNLNKMKWEDKRKLVQAIFSGKDINGNRAGVYVRKNDKGVLEYDLAEEAFIVKNKEDTSVEQNCDSNYRPHHWHRHRPHHWH